MAQAGEEAQQTYDTLKRMTGGGSSFLAGIRRDYLRKQWLAAGKTILGQV